MRSQSWEYQKESLIHVRWRCCSELIECFTLVSGWEVLRVSGRNLFLPSHQVPSVCLRLHTQMAPVELPLNSRRTSVLSQSCPDWVDHLAVGSGSRCTALGTSTNRLLTKFLCPHVLRSKVFSCWLLCREVSRTTCDAHHHIFKCSGCA